MKGRAETVLPRVVVISKITLSHWPQPLPMTDMLPDGSKNSADIEPPGVGSRRLINVILTINFIKYISESIQDFWTCFVVGDMIV